MSKRKAKTKPEAESKIELKPCPHCGGLAIITSCNGDGEGGKVYTAVCSNCDTETVIFNTPQAAAEAWNRRV